MTFAFELLLSWNVAFVATHNLRKRIVLKRSKIAQFYVWHSTFIFDFISTMVFIVQVHTYLALKAAFIKDCWFSHLHARAVCVHVHLTAQEVAAICHQHQCTITMHNGQHCPANDLHSSSGTTLLAHHHAFTCQSIQGMLNIRRLPQKCVRFLLKSHQPTALLVCTQPSWELACSALDMGWVQQAPAVAPSFKSSRFCELSGDTYSQCPSDCT